MAAYEDLSAPIRSLVDEIQAVHLWHNYDGSVPSAVHPVVRVHPETGERALFVNPPSPPASSVCPTGRATWLLDLLFHQIGRPEFGVRFRWKPGSVAFWDNRATAHVGPVDLELAELGREVRRVTLVGDVPVGPDGFSSTPIQR